MGSTTVHKTVRGASMRDAFDQAVREAEREYGTDYYNGEINNCELRGDKTKEYNAAKDKKKFLDDLLEDLSKREVVGIELEAPVKNTNKVKTKVEIIPNKGTRQWETTFEVEKSFDPSGQIHAVGKTQGDAIAKARKLCEAQKETFEVVIRKRLVKGGSRVATISYKQAGKEKEGKYLFIGWAPI